VSLRDWPRSQAASGEKKQRRCGERRPVAQTPLHPDLTDALVPASEPSASPALRMVSRRLRALGSSATRRAWFLLSRAATPHRVHPPVAAPGRSKVSKDTLMRRPRLRSRRVGGAIPW
jgi:hypothetical protein